MIHVNDQSDPSPSAPEHTSDAGREKRSVALTSVGAAIVLTGTKLFVGLATSSLGILAEAAHSGLDLVAAVITYFAVRISDKPADAEHHYGHGKVENLSALIETLLLLITCAWIIWEAVERLFFKNVAVDASFWAFAVIVVSIVIDISRSRALRRVALKHQSQALEADALHFSTDVWSSAVVLAGLTLVRVGEGAAHAQWLGRADSVAALAVAVIVIGVSWRLGRRTVDALLDRAPAGQVEAVERAVRQVEGVLEVRDVRLRQAGNQTFVDLVIGVRRDISLESSHNLGVAVEQQVQQLLPNADVVVHVDPVCGTNETVADRIRVLAANAGQAVHNVWVSEEGGRLYVELHLEVDADLELRFAHDAAHQLEDAINADLPLLAGITIHIEPHRDRQAPLRDVTDVSADLIRKVRRAALATAGIVACEKVAVRRAGQDVFLALQCTFDAALSVGQVHDISTGLENRLRKTIPHLVRVTTHAEPVGT